MTQLKYVFSVLMGAVLMASSMPASASSLTPAQVQAVVNLLQSFGADASVTANVQAALGGTTTASSCASFSDLKIGDTDSAKAGRVSELQHFLGSLLTGYYGPITQAAWKATCASNSISLINSGTLSADPASGAVPLTVQFVGGKLTGGSQYVIDFGDRTISGPLGAINICMGTLQNPAGCPRITTHHTYTRPGNYLARLVPYVSCLFNAPYCQVAVPLIASTTVTVAISSQVVAPVISSVSPVSGRVGTQITITGSGFSSDNTVHFGAGGKQHVASSDGTNITYTIPQSVGPCDTAAPAAVCAMYVQQVTPGTYGISVSNENGSSNSQQFSVTQ